MAKRFTDTEKWEDRWFFALATDKKLIWQYLCDRCNHAGIWQVNQGLMQVFCGCPVDLEEALVAFGDRVMKIGDGNYWWLTKFCQFQYGCLQISNKTHLSVIKILKKHNLEDQVEIGDGKDTALKRSRMFILERDNFTCLYCGKRFKSHQLQVDHFKPSSKDGDNSKDNLVAACSECNSKKKDLFIDDFCLKFGIDSQKILTEYSLRISRNPQESILGPKDKDMDKVMDKEKLKNEEAELDARVIECMKEYPNTRAGGVSTHKGSKDRIKVKEILKKGEYPLLEAIRFHKRTANGYFKNMTSFLNNLPEPASMAPPPKPPGPAKKPAHAHHFIEQEGKTICALCGVEQPPELPT